MYPAVTGFIQANSGMLILISISLTLVVVVAVLVLLVQFRNLKKPFSNMAELYQRQGASSALEELLKGVDENREFIKGNAEEIKKLMQRFRGCYSAMGIVKYNAFEDIGGNQSYSICLLTDERNGFVLTNLVGRNSARGYALEITDGKPARELSEEESTAVGDALGSV